MRHRPAHGRRVSDRRPHGYEALVDLGKYLEVKPGEKLVYTWQWDFDPTAGAQTGDTRVTVEFRDLGKETEVTLTHEGFESEPAREGHKKGWLGCFDRLEKFV